MNLNMPDWSKKIQQPQYVIIGLIVFMILWMTGSAMMSAVNNRLIGKLEVESTVSEVSFSAYGFVDPVEDVIVPDVSGQAQPFLEAGERTAKSERVLKVASQTAIDGESQTEDKYFYAPIAGLMSYDIDGYERMDQSQDIGQLDLKALYEKELSRKPAGPNDRAQANQAYGKVIDNLAPPQLVLVFYPDHNDIFQEVGDVFRIRFPDFDASSVATVEDLVSIDAEKSLAIVRLGPMSDEFLQTRFVKCQPYRIEPALIELPKDAVVVREDQVGVYTIANQMVTWTRVTVEEEGAETVKIKSPAAGTTIITSPSRVELGDYLP